MDLKRPNIRKILTDYSLLLVMPALILHIASCGTSPSLDDETNAIELRAEKEKAYDFCVASEKLSNDSDPTKKRESNESKLVTTKFRSRSFDDKCFPVNIYLPRGYSIETETPYRAAIFLHGCCGADQNYAALQIKAILDTKIANGEIQPMIVAFPGAIGLDYSANSQQGLFENLHLWQPSYGRHGNYEALIVDDLYQTIKRYYNVSETREKWALWGHSMGGLGAGAIAVKYPTLFQAVATHNGISALDAYYLSGFALLLSESPGLFPPYTYDPQSGFLTRFAFGLSSVLSPSLDGVGATNYYPQYNLDMIMSKNATLTNPLNVNVIESIWKPKFDITVLLSQSSFFNNSDQGDDVAIYADANHFSIIDPSNTDFMRPFVDAFEDWVISNPQAANYPIEIRTFDGISQHDITDTQIESAVDWLDQHLN